MKKAPEGAFFLYAVFQLDTGHFFTEGLGKQVQEKEIRNCVQHGMGQRGHDGAKIQGRIQPLLVPQYRPDIHDEGINHAACCAKQAQKPSVFLQRFLQCAGQQPDQAPGQHLKRRPWPLTE